jgi:hypothetical protein
MHATAGRAPRWRRRSTTAPRFPGVHGCLGFILGLAAASAVATGCGDEERRASGSPDPEHASEVARDPYALTCGDLARQSRPDGTRLVIRVQAALTRERALRKQVAEQGFQRVNQSVYFALTEVCNGRDPSFRPARLAAEGVRRGKYRASLCLGPGCSEEVRWLAARVGDDGGLVRLVTANSSSARPWEVAVRLDEAEVGLALRMRVPDVGSEDVRLHCAEVALGEPVGKRELVDDGPRRFNPFGVSVAAAEKQLGQGKLRCVRVASISG